MTYIFKTGKPSTFVEIYLPKKSGFQGALYRALVDARNPKEVKDHLLRYENKIKMMLEQDWSIGHTKFIHSFIEDLSSNIGSIYVGFSMYEVDGVFFSKNSIDPCEERTQVIRIIFEFPVADALPLDTLIEVKKFLRSPARSLNEYGSYDKKYEKELKLAEDWIVKTGVFLTGFIIHRIILAIEENPDLQQDEMWVTSFWNTVLNKFLPQNR